MKTLIVVMMLASGIARAGIIELPKGSAIWQMPDYLRVNFFDEATVVPLVGSPTDKGWISLYGDLDGGTLFDTNLFALDPTSSANLWWDFDHLGYSLHYIVVNDGEDNCKIYSLGGRDRFSGNLDLGPFDNATIRTLTLYGRLSIPDTGSTVLLLAVGIAALQVRRARQ